MPKIEEVFIFTFKKTKTQNCKTPNKMKFKNIVLILMFCWLCLPFILLIDFFPFFRYGMFAEPVKTTKQAETFELFFINNLQEKKNFNSEWISVHRTHFTYITRYYVYKQKSTQLLQKIHQIYAKNQEIVAWQIYQVQFDKQNVKKERKLIAFWKVNEK